MESFLFFDLCCSLCFGDVVTGRRIDTFRSSQRDPTSRIDFTLKVERMGFKEFSSL